MSKKNKDTMHFGASPAIFKVARELRQKMTLAEKILWEELRDKRCEGIKFRNQHPVLRYVLDFYCHQYRLGIELDGGVHNTKSQVVYDEDRTKNISECGLRIIRFKNSEVIENVEEVINKILEKLEL